MAAARADVAEPAGNRYEVIHVRNPFGLKDPPPVVTSLPTNPVAPVNVKFTGITSDLAGKKAWLMIPGQPGGKNPNPQYLSIPEHEKQGDIEVLEINEKDSTVKILNAGTTVELNFKDNGLPTPASLMVPGTGLTPHGAPGALPAPGSSVRVCVPVGPAGTAIGVPVTAVRKGPGGDHVFVISPDAQGKDRAHLRPVLTGTEPPVQAAEGPVDPAVQRVLMEVQKAQAEQQGKAFPPLPPVPANSRK